MNNDDAPGHVLRDPAERRYVTFRQCLSDQSFEESTGHSTRAPRYGMPQSRQQPENKEHVEQLQDHTSENNPHVNNQFLVPSDVVLMFYRILSDRKTK
jgi:hypothetical protein